MRASYLAAIAILVVVISSCSLRNSTGEKCNLASDCVAGKCPDGYKYNKFSCVEHVCSENNFFADPCMKHYNNIDDSAGCSRDEDCGTGGCSGELCGKKGETDGLVTTCEFKEEYGCLRLTKCSCVGGKCNWKANDAYNECMSGIAR